MLEIKDLSISFQGRFLIKNLSLTLKEKDKLAIIGEEGNGKTTLLKTILGMDLGQEVTGIINTKNLRIGYLPQAMEEKFQKVTVSQFLWKNEEEYYDTIGKFYSYLETFALKEEVIQQEIHTLSGGEKVKVGILKLLLEENDILFLDEPTNDLDLETLIWLEDFICREKRPILYVSHDEILLKETANRILHLEQIKNQSDCRYTLANMDYTSYLASRMQDIENQEQQAKFEKRQWNKKQEKLNRVMQKVEYQQATISRSDPHGAKLLKKKMHSLKSQERKLAATTPIENPDIEEAINLTFAEVELPKRKKILDFHLTELTNNEKILAKNIHLEVIGNEHICITGKNGIGKSTLIKEIYQTLKERCDLQVGYMPQNYEDILPNDGSVLDFLTESKDKEEMTKVYSYLGNLKLTEEEMRGKINRLSNGTKAKVLLLQLVLKKYNVLILDEPTRNISPLSIPIICQALKKFQGAIISISHDRTYISEVIHQVYELTENGLIKK